MTRWTRRSGAVAALVSAVLLSSSAPAAGAESLCDPAFQDCRAVLISLIRNENIGIDAGWWFMEDARYKTELINRFKAGVPVRVLIDPRANAEHPINAQILAVSEDKIQGFMREPFVEIAQKSGVPLETVLERIKTMLAAGTIRRPCSVRPSLMSAYFLARRIYVTWVTPVILPSLSIRMYSLLILLLSSDNVLITT